MSSRTGIPLSPVQRAMLAGQRRRPDSAAHNMALLAHIDGPVVAARLADAFDELVARTRVLSDVLVEGPDGAVWTQRRGEAPTSRIATATRDEALSWCATRARVALRPEECLYDSAIFTHPDGSASWYLNLHHLATDATSSALVFEATAEIYEGGEVRPRADYHQWISDQAVGTSTRHERAALYWQANPTPPPLNNLYGSGAETGATSPAHRVVVADASDLRLPEGLTSLSEQLGWTTVMTTVAAVLMARLSGETKVSVGIPVHHRRGKVAKSVIGPVLEVVPITVEPDLTLPMRSIHDGVAAIVFDALAHSAPGRTPPADVDALVNVISHAAFPAFGSRKVSVEWIHNGSIDARNLLQLQLTPYGSPEGQFIADIARSVAPPDPRSVASHVLTLTRALLDDDRTAAAQLNLCTDAEMAAQRRWGTGTALRSDDLLLGRLRDALAERHTVAVDDTQAALTGQELWNTAGRWALALHEMGVTPGSRVAIELPRSTTAVIAVLAVLRAGASYVPVDPSAPPQRRRSLIERSGSVLSIDPEMLGTLKRAPAPDPRTLERLDRARPEDEAYLLFTSGSTGTPKGVPISHRGLADYINNATELYFEGTKPVVAPLFSALTFDLTVTTMFAPLLVGGKIVPIAEDGVDGLRSISQMTELTWIKATPTHLDVLRRLEPRCRLETIVVGGERFTSKLAEAIREVFGNEVRQFNEYGPTECVVGCMIHEAEPFATGPDVPIGTPHPGTSLRIVDDYDRPVPVGATGQLLVSHRGITPGYLDRRDDAGRFVDLEGRRWYRTGDLVRLVDERTAVFVGRADDQIKVGGIRLEPAEIEAAIAKQRGVSAVAVRLWSPPDEQDVRPMLVAWVVPEIGAHLDIAVLRRAATTMLPSAAVPSAYVEIESLPLTPNGKLDHERLRPPDRADRPRAGRAEPRSQSEALVVELYEQLLGMSGVSIDDDFFELGGDSLGALRLAARLRSGGFETSDEWVFKATTPRDLASLIGERTDIEGPVKRSDATAPELTPGEAAILFEQAADPRNVRYNVARDYHIETSQPQAIDLAQLARSVEEVAARHAPFTWTYSAPRRKLKPSSIVEVDIEQATTSKEDFDQLAQRAQRRPFDLDNGPMLRLTARHLDDGTTAVSIATHHVTIDAGTFDVLWHQIDDRYRGGPLRAGDDAPDNADVFSWQIGRLSDAALDRWIERLQPSPAEIDLGRHDGADGLARRVLGLSEHQLGTGLSTFTTLLAAWVMALRRRSDGNEILTGVVTSVRTHQAMDDLVGYHLNTLPMMIDTGDETTSMSEVVSRLKASTTAALADRTVPLASIVSELRRRTSRELELSNLFVLERLNSVELGGHRARPEVRWSGQTVADATLFVQVTDGLIELLLEYRGSKLSESNALLLLDDVAAFAESIVNLGPLSHLSVPLPSDVPPASLLEEPAATSLVEILAKAAATTTATSVIDAGGRLSWPDLWQGAQRLAGYLDATGLSSSTVAVEARRSSATVMAMLGIQLAQGAYQPIDPAYPADYLVQVLKDSESRAVLVDGHPTGNAADAYRALGTEIIDIRSALTSGFSPIERTIGPADPAYVIHTSGSTGLPKGVLIRQSHIAYSTMARSLSYPQSPERFLMISSMAFDSSMVGLWWPLSFGGTVVLPQDGRSDDVAHIIDLIEQHRITHTLMLPTLWEIVLRTAGASRLGSLKVVIVAGEACSAALVRLHHSSLPGCLLANEYGPTEGTVWSHRLITQGDESDPVPIGQVAPGSRSIVVGPGPVKRPVGVPGELLISGPGVADGYLGRPELSAESFVEFESTRWYRTGDLVDVHASGGFRFLGRVDDQVKVRGHRIELAAVDALVTERAGAPAAATVAAAANGTQQLVVFVEGTVDAPALRESLKASLPPAMVPSRIDRIDRLPRRPNGKLDRKALADLDHQRRSEESEPNVPQHDRDGATNEVEAHLLDAWRSALGIETIGPDDDFFDLGGDSIVAIRIAAALSKHGLTFSPRTIFEHATVRSLAAEVEQSSVGDPPLSGHTDLLPIQRWFFERGFAEPDRWSQGIVLNLAAAIDTQELEAAIGWLVNRHESLRATFEVGESGPTQTIHPSPLGPPLIGIWPDDESAKTATTDWLDIGTGRLLAAGLIGTEPSRRVVINAHHLVVDAVSWAILTEDLEWFLSSRREPTSDSPPMRHTSTQSWVERLRDMPPVAASGPQVSTRPTALEHETVHVSRQLSPQAAQRMLSEPRSIADTVAGAAVAAAKASDSPLIHDGRLAVTFERHGREASRPLDLTRTVGWFTTTETIHATATDDPELALAEVRSCLEGLGATDLVSARRAIQHGDTGPDDVVRINQLGSVPGPTGTGRVIELVEGPFAIVGDKNRRTHLLGILIRTGADQVELFFDYAPSDLPDAQAIALIDRLVATLEAQSDRGSHNADSLQQRFALSGLNEQQLTRLGALLDGLD